MHRINSLSGKKLYFQKFVQLIDLLYNFLINSAHVTEKVFLGSIQGLSLVGLDMQGIVVLAELLLAASTLAQQVIAVSCFIASSLARQVIAVSCFVDCCPAQQVIAVS